MIISFCFILTLTLWFFKLILNFVQKLRQVKKVQFFYLFVLIINVKKLKSFVKN